MLSFNLIVELLDCMMDDYGLKTQCDCEWLNVLFHGWILVFLNRACVSCLSLYNSRCNSFLISFPSNVTRGFLIYLCNVHRLGLRIGFDIYNV